MGEPSSLNNEQKDLLRKAAEPGIASSDVTAENGKIGLKYTLKPNEVRFFEIKKIERKPDYGYDYDKVLAHKCIPDENAE